MRYRLAVEFHRHAYGAEIHETGESILVALGGVAGISTLDEIHDAQRLDVTLVSLGEFFARVVLIPLVSKLTLFVESVD